MSTQRRRTQVPSSDISSSDRVESSVKSTVKSAPRHSASDGQNDTILYIVTVVILVVGLILGYKQMPSSTPPGLNKAIFNPRLYSHIQSLWFAEVPAGATVGGEASMKKWFYNPNADERVAFDKLCGKEFRPALDEIGPKRLRLPPFLNFTVERQMARNLASPLMSEIDASSNNLSTEDAASNALSLILLLDQLSRNIFRSEQALIYAHYDRIAQALIHYILATHPRLDLVPKYSNFPVFRSWFYMPLMHSEHIEDHVLYNSLMTSMKEDMAKAGDTAAVRQIETNLDYEAKHVKIIEQFGRYPHRNQALGRETTAEEKKFLDDGGDTFGTSG